MYADTPHSFTDSSIIFMFFKSFMVKMYSSVPSVVNIPGFHSPRFKTFIFLLLSFILLQ